jgi:hypothetical protein
VPTAQALDDKNFKGGIGFYVESDGQMNPLSWPANKGKELKTTSVIKTKKTDRLYSYGLDFSKGSGSGVGLLPPHLIGFTWAYFEPDGTRKGIYPVRFQPISGPNQPTYQLLFDGPMPAIISGKIKCKRFFLNLPEVGSYVFELE